MWQEDVFDEQALGLDVGGVAHCMVIRRDTTVFLWPCTSPSVGPHAPKAIQELMRGYLDVPTLHTVLLQKLCDQIESGAAHVLIGGHPFDRDLLSRALNAVYIARGNEPVCVGWREQEGEIPAAMGGGLRPSILARFAGADWTLLVMALSKPPEVLDLAAWLAVQ